MKSLQLSANPNQSFSVRLDNSLYAIAIKTVNDTCCIDVSRDNVALLKAMRITPGTPILPYKYQQQGNLVFTTIGDDLPDYSKFGISQHLFYLTIEEVAGFQNG